MSDKNFWVLNKLAPLEYCSITRASKLLNCEIEDLLHWHDIGSLNLCIKLGKTKGVLKITINHADETTDKKSLELYLSNTITFNELTRIKKIWSRHSKVYHVLTLNDGVIKPTIIKNDLTTYELKSLASEIWSINSRNLSILLDESDYTYVETDVSAVNPSPQILSSNFYPEEDERPVININNIFITMETIEKIHSHALSGKILPFIEGVSSSDNNESINIKTISPHKEKLSDFIRFLIQTNPTINKKILSTTANNRHKLFKDYLDELKLKGIEIDYDIPSSPTLERYLKL